MKSALNLAWGRLCRWSVLGLMTSVSAMTDPAWAFRSAGTASVELRRTTDGIPHIRASTWRGLGIGYGYAQAQDALCTLAEGFVTLSGRRSYYFGADGRSQAMTAPGKPSNLENDFFFRSFADQKAVDAFKREQPSDLTELIVGFAEGYNRYLRTLSRRGLSKAPHACGEEPWVQAIQPEDIYRRMIAAALGAGYGRFISEISNARPMAGMPPAPVDGISLLRSKLEVPVGDMKGLGSNVLAFGKRATGERGGVLLGNPHWYWGGPDRFYQAHLTLPGRMDVAGVSFLGIPVIMIGFNDHVAWSHTVSAARRFGLFELALDAADPTRYVIDGVSEPMQAVPLAVEVRGPDDAINTVHRTLYRTRFGPVVDLGQHHEAFGWSAKRALVIRDVNADNHRVFRNFFRWNRAKSLNEFIAIQHEETGMPWVNTAAIGRGDGRVWYADMGAVPDIPDDLRAACAAPLSKAFAVVDPRTPLLDGSRSACQWRVDPAAVQAGAMAAARMPALLRDDYVSNMNDSYWLSNAAQPLVGYPSILGAERSPLSLRSREGHRIAQELASTTATSAQNLAKRLMRQALGAQAYSAEQFKKALLDHACPASGVNLDSMAVNAQKVDGVAHGPQAVDVRSACGVLREWSNRADAQDRGALLWDAFWARLQKIPVSEFYAIPFSADAPLQTPREPRASDPRVIQALVGAVGDMEKRGWALDMPLGSQRFVRSEGQQVPIFGGCDATGYFAVACNGNGEYAMGKTSIGNSYLQVVYFGRQGVEAHTLLAHGQRETAVENGSGISPVARYARKDWLRFPFHENDIARDPALTRVVLWP